MLGGGSFISQSEKRLPGSYINFVSAAKVSASLAERGYVAVPMILDWGVDGDVFTVTSGDFYKNSRAIFGYDYAHEKMKNLRDLFMYAETAYIYKLGTGAVKASCEFATATYAGTRGNSLRIVIAETTEAYEVSTYLDLVLVDTQFVNQASELVDNDFVTFNSEAQLAETASMPLIGGVDGTVDSGSWQEALDALGAYSFNVIGAATTDDSVKKLVAEWTKMMRDDVGVKFQAVVYDYAADDKAVINVVSKPKDGAECDLVYWVAGAEAGCKVNASLTNKVYNGEYDVDVKVSQVRLVEALDKGEFIFHRVGDDARVLEDINSKVTVSIDENEDFKSNQTIRVIDQVAMDIASMFNTRYLGIVPNDNAGRISLWNDIVKHHQEMMQVRAIEGYEPEHTTVEQGDTKKSVIVNDMITPVNAMAQMFMTVVVA